MREVVHSRKERKLKPAGFTSTSHMLGTLPTPQHEHCNNRHLALPIMISHLYMLNLPIDSKSYYIASSSTCTSGIHIIGLGSILKVHVPNKPSLLHDKYNYRPMLKKEGCTSKLVRKI